MHTTSVCALFHFPETHKTHAAALEARPYPALQKHTPWAPLLELRPVDDPDDTYPVVAVQAMHVFEVCVFVVLAIYVPASQLVHTSSDLVLFHLPEAQSSQAVDLEARPYPASQTQAASTLAPLTPVVVVV